MLGSSLLLVSTVSSRQISKRGSHPVAGTLLAPQGTLSLALPDPVCVGLHCTVGLGHQACCGRALVAIADVAIVKYLED